MSDDFNHTFKDKNGRLVGLRPLKLEDAHHLVDLFEHMGAESRYLRFNLSLTDPDPELVWSEARRLAQIDPARDGAWLAFCDLPDQAGAPIAGIRYMRVDQETAEASLVVRDDMQNQGIGTELLKYLLSQARAAGIRRLTASVQRGNRSLWRLLSKSPVKIERESQGSTTTLTAIID
jgi:acetyltransferase